MHDDDNFFDQLRKQHSPQQASEIDGGSDAALKPENSDAVENTQIEEDLPADVSAENSELQNPGMPPEARRALVSLLRLGVILSSRKSKLFESICRYQADIRRHFSDMYLKLVLDEKMGVAFVSSVDEEDAANTEFQVGDEKEEAAVSLITRRTLSLYDTLLLLILRKHYQERETSGEQKVVIDVERVESNLTPFLPLTNSSKGDRKKLHAALQKMVEKRILSAVRGSEDRFEITPIIRYIVNAEFLESMLAEYNVLANAHRTIAEPEVSK